MTTATEPDAKQAIRDYEWTLLRAHGPNSARDLRGETILKPSPKPLPNEDRP